MRHALRHEPRPSRREDLARTGFRPLSVAGVAQPMRPSAPARRPA